MEDEQKFGMGGKRRYYDEYEGEPVAKSTEEIKEAQIFDEEREQQEAEPVAQTEEKKESSQNETSVDDEGKEDLLERLTRNEEL